METAGARMAIELREVFTPGGQPSVTYVGREHLDLEGLVRRAMKQGFALNVVTGPTKSGKTVLCTRVLDSDGKYIAVEGGQVRSESDFWNQAAYQLNIAQEASRAVATTDGSQGGVTFSGGIPQVLQATISGGKNASSQSTDSLKYQNVAVLAVADKLIEGKISLLVDDFHYIPSDVQKSIIQALKGPIFKGLSVIFLAVPHRAFDPITVEDEMQGRFRHVPIPSWSGDDLVLIPERGFDALNVDCAKSLQKRICDESFGNPLLVQEICSELCARANIFERAEKRHKIDPDLLEVTLQTVAESKGFPKYRKLKEGPQARKARQPRKFKDGTSADIYEALMIAIGKLGPKPRTQYDELRSELRDLLEDGQMPQKHEITAALSHMSKIARDKIEGEPPLEFVREEDALVITDPFLLFYMKWQKEKSAPGSSG